MLEMALIVEQLSAAGGGSTVGQLFMINPIFGGVSISRFGTPSDEAATLLPKIIAGEINCCMALTEPDAGSNSLEIKTFATRAGNGWRLNGRKIWITGVESAQKMLVVARTTKVRRQGRAHARPVDVPDRCRAQGPDAIAPIEKLGTNTLSSCNVFFDDVEVDGSELVGTLDGGWYELLDVLNTERIVTTAGLVGAAELAIRLAVDYAKERRVFAGKPIASLPGPPVSAGAALGRGRMRAADELQGGGAVRQRAGPMAPRPTSPSCSPRRRPRPASSRRCRPWAAWALPRTCTSSGYGAMRVCSASRRSRRR